MRTGTVALLLVVALTATVGCGDTTPPARDPATGKRPQTAAERARAEHVDDDQPVTADGKKWGGWRYRGRRDTCYYVVGRRCFDKRADACAAARCGNQQQCVVEGGGPARVSCR